jgi:hypothetical protein
MEVRGQLHAPAALPPWRSPGTHCIGGWVGSKTAKWRRKILPLPGLELRPLGRPAHSQLIYGLCHPESQSYRN